jgi:glycosyltransferase involved in cell wall biosynthesis
MIVHLFVSEFEAGAVGTHTLLARDALVDAGHPTEIYALHVAPAYAGSGARDAMAYRDRADVVVYQFAIGSVVADVVREQPAPVVVNHHNLTPWRYLAGWQPAAAHGVAYGHAQLHAFATRAALGLAVSEYNEADLIEAGYPNTAVVPIFTDLSHFDGSSPSPRAEPAEDTTTWLFVGRLAPNKAQHDVVKAFAAYRRLHNPDARLHLVGGGVDEPYGQTLRRFIHGLDLDDAVTLPGSVSTAQLSEYYATADVFVACSEHEGFCVPLLEAMHFGVPIVAFAAAAVPETLGDAGLLLTVKDPCTVAAAVDRVARNPELRAQMIALGTERLSIFDPARIAPMFVDAITSAVTER